MVVYYEGTGLFAFPGKNQRMRFDCTRQKIMYLLNMLLLKITLWLIFCESRQLEGEYGVSKCCCKILNKNLRLLSAAESAIIGQPLSF